MHVIMIDGDLCAALIYVRSVLIFLTSIFLNAANAGFRLATDAEETGSDSTVKTT